MNMRDSLQLVLEQSNYFMPHGHCYLWIPSILWMHVISDGLIALSYLVISGALVMMVRRMKLQFSPIYLAFGLFIFLCGCVHAMEIWTVWNPDYVAAGVLKALCAAASLATAAGLVAVLPQIADIAARARENEKLREQLDVTMAELDALKGAGETTS